tara:strand:+ start:303 stop:608 length:306 start_codon:yes stop_codon:yes gene_type:complete
MAKKATVERNKKRARMVEKYAERRNALKALLKDPKTSDEDFYKAQDKLAKLPRDSSPVRLSNRCSITGRVRSTIRKFGVSRLTFRELACHGKLPGVMKSSW